ncbi:MAG: flavodoxin family protein [Bacillota bacterium]|nr:flavodoxin family protein [Bacillota bacterium]
MKVLIAYSSKTGNTEYFCNEVYKNIKDDCEQIDIAKLKDVSGYEDYDMVVAGFWVDRTTANAEAMKFIKKIHGKKVALLGTLGASPDSEHAAKVRENVKELVHESNEYLGVRLARGKVDEKMIKRIKLIPFVPKKIKDQMYETSIHSREPNAEEIAEATAFMKSILA